MQTVGPSGLREIEERLAATILAGGEASPASLGPLLLQPPRGDLAERLGAYTGGYPARIEEALRETYPAVAHIVGGPVFARLAREYVTRGGLTRHSYNLNHVGAELASFLRSHELTQGLPFLPDLASLEWRVTCAFHAPDEALLDTARLATWSGQEWEAAALGLHPSVSVVRSEWPIDLLWQARDTPREEIDIDLRDRARCVLVRRRGLEVACEAIAKREADCLEAILHGETLGEVAAALHDVDGEDITAWFSRWMALGLVCGARSTPRQGGALEGLAGAM